MRTWTTAAWVLVAVAAASCAEGGAPWNQTPNGPTETKPFSTNTSTAVDPFPNKFGNRFGPATAPYNDVVTSAYAPSTAGNTAAFGIPPLVVWPIGLSTTSALNLETGAELWRKTEAFTLFATDGTTVCGKVGQSTQASTFVCLDVQTGAERWRKVLDAWLDPPPGQGYGLAAELVFRGDRLFVLGGGKVFSLDLATGAERWTAQVFPKFRGLTFVGDDLVLEGARGCAQGNSCLRAVNPLTGATLAEAPAETASFLWQLDGKALFATPVSGLSRSVEIWDSATNTFTNDTSYQASFANLNVGIYNMLAGLSPVIDGAVLLYKPSNQMDSLAVGGAQVCRYEIASRTVSACISPQSAGGVGGVVRLYRNALIFGTASGPGGGLRYAWPALDQPSTGTPVICFGATCSAGGQDFAYYR